MDGFHTDLTGLTEAEAQTLLLSAPARLLADLGLRKAGEAALMKLLAALPSATRRDVEDLRQRIHVDGAGWGREAEAVPCLSTLQEAVWRERRVRLAYQRADGGLMERLVDPLGLVAKGTNWYLVGTVDGKPRTLRVARVQSADILEEPCTRPPDFDLAEHWAGSTADFVAGLPRYAAVVRVAPEALPKLWIPGSYAQVEQVNDPEPNGWRTVHLRLQTEDEACRYVVGFGPRMEVIAPTTLREQVLQTTRAVVAAYEGPAPIAPDKRPCRVI